METKTLTIYIWVSEINARTHGLIYNKIYFSNTVCIRSPKQSKYIDPHQDTWQRKLHCKIKNNYIKLI